MPSSGHADRTSHLPHPPSQPRYQPASASFEISTPKENEMIYVPIVLTTPSFVALRGNIDSILPQIASSNFATLYTEDERDYVGIVHHPSHKDAFKDTNLIEIMIFLKEFGVFLVRTTNNIIHQLHI